MRTAPLAQALTDEFHAKRRQYVLDNTRERWRFVGCGVVLLAAARLTGLTAASWPFIGLFTVCFAGVNYAVARVARDRPFRSWYAHANIAIGTGMISSVAFAAGPSGDLLFPAYLIAPLQAAYHLGRIEAWETLGLNIVAFALVTAIIPHGWGWVAFFKEVLVLVFVAVALVPEMLSMVARVRSGREVLAQVEHGDLTVRADESERDELGYLGATVNRTIDAIARVVGDAQRNAAEVTDAVDPRQVDAAVTRLEKTLQRLRIDTAASGSKRK